MFDDLRDLYQEVIFDHNRETGSSRTWGTSGGRTIPATAAMVPSRRALFSERSAIGKGGSFLPWQLLPAKNRRSDHPDGSALGREATAIQRRLGTESSRARAITRACGSSGTESWRARRR